MNRYELIYILDTAVEESTRKELIEKFNQLIVAGGGEVEKVDEWGKRRLAYTIDYKTEGYYVLVIFKAGPEVPREIERNLEINESVIRYLVVKLLNKRSSVKPRAARPVFQSASSAPVEEVAVVEEVVAVEEAAPVVETVVAEEAAAVDAAPEVEVVEEVAAIDAAPEVEVAEEAVAVDAAPEADE